MKKTNFLIFLFLLLTVFVVPLKASGAILYFEPSEGKIKPGDVVLIKMKISTEEECINVIKADVSFPKELMKILDVNLGTSILSQWLSYPKKTDYPRINSEGEVSFIGGVPGGYCGIIPGDPGKSDIIAELIFKVINSSSSENRLAEIKYLPASEVLLNNGAGTKAKVRFQNAAFLITSEAKPRKNEWEEKLKEDKIPPEPFAVGIFRTKKLFGGKYFIVFSTTDKQSGIDHYELKEVNKNGYIPRTKTKAQWEIVSSPYVLKDQGLNSIIYIKAVDKAWNERIVKFIPSEHIKVPPEGSKWPSKEFLIGVILFVSSVVFVGMKRKKKK